MKEHKVCVELSAVYDNNRVHFDGLRIGERGVFSDDANFDDYIISNLIGLVTTCNRPYCMSDEDGYRKYYKYYIPLGKAVFKAVDVEPSYSYRAFKSIDEFEAVTQNHFCMGESVIIRNKEKLNESELVYNGFFTNDEFETFICLGPFVFSFKELFKRYEFHVNNSIDEWLPFGMKER